MIGQKLEKEIYDQRNELQMVFNLVKDQPPDLSCFAKAQHVYFVGCGSSYYLAIAAAKYFSRRLGKFTKAVPGGEIAFNFSENVHSGDSSSLAVLISRSGNSTEIVLAAQMFRRHGIRTFCISLNPDCELRKKCDNVIILPVVEDSIVMTKSFSSMLLSLLVIADLVGGKELDAYRTILDNMDYFFTEVMPHNLIAFRHFVFLGSGVYEGIARESALKVEETSLTQAEAFSTFEYRHGPKALASDGTLMVVFSAGTSEEKKFIDEMKQYKVHLIERNSVDPLGRDAFAQVIYSQLLVLRLARLKGIDPERPRNLERVVRFDL